MTRYILIDAGGSAYEMDSHAEAMQVINNNPNVFLMLWKQEHDGTDWQTVEESAHNRVTMRETVATASTDPLARA